jgi:hypothetical protein
MCNKRREFPNLEGFLLRTIFLFEFSFNLFLGKRSIRDNIGQNAWPIEPGMLPLDSFIELHRVFQFFSDPPAPLGHRL